MNIEAMEDNVQTEWNPQLAHRCHRSSLMIMPIFNPGNLIGQAGVRRLEADLNIVQTSVHQRRRATLSKPDRARNQIGIRSRFVRYFNQLLYIRPVKRLASRKANLEDNQPDCL